MPDMGAIAGAISALKSATDIAKAMKNLRDGQLVQAKVIELQCVILDAQNSLFSANEERAALVDQVRHLEKELAGLKAWDAGKDRYALTDAGRNNMAYALKPAMRGTEPAHYICANCYQKGQKSLLHHMDTASMGDVLTCPTCNAKMLIRTGYKPPT